MLNQHHKMVKPDAKGRIALGKLAEGVSRFRITYDEQHRITLEPLVEIPAYEKWLFNNKIALKAVKQGLKNSAEGCVSSRGSFAQYLNEETD